MDNTLYKEIFKRKSFHTFRERINEAITQEELNKIVDAFNSSERLFPDIKVAMEIKKSEGANLFRNEEYCLRFFSERKPGYLQNVGYIGEQLDLIITSMDIGSLWYGIAKSNDTLDGLDYVILIAIAKVDKTKFRNDMFKAKRKEVSEMWEGDELNVANIVRFSPSACNSQPWLVINKENELSVYRKSKSGKVGIMPKDKSVFYNQIDIGIFMCILEICLAENKIKYERELFEDTQQFDEPVLNAKYKL